MSTQVQRISEKALHALRINAVSPDTSRVAAKKKNFSEVILEIQERMKESEPVLRITLADENLKELESFFANDQKMLQKIQVYNHFIKGPSGKRIL